MMKQIVSNFEVNKNCHFKLPFMATSVIKQVLAICGNIVKQILSEIVKSDLSSLWQLLS